MGSKDKLSVKNHMSTLFFRKIWDSRGDCHGNWNEIKRKPMRDTEGGKEEENEKEG
jgi:hypothetical protein